MNDNNMTPKKPSGSDRTRSFTNTSKLSKNNDEELKVDTAINIKKATAKKVLKKGTRMTGGIIAFFASAVLTLLVIGIICGVIVGSAFAIYTSKYLIDDDFDIEPSELRNDLSQTSWIYYNDKYVQENGEKYDPIEIYGTENRQWVSYDDMPKHLVDAFIAIEDERYRTHNGVDWRRTFGAVLSFATGSDNYGGSTITQQLIKNVTGEDDTTIQRKVTEIFRALSLNEKRTKDEVLEMYLNRIHLSRSNYGVGAAAKYYFGKEVSELTVLESAALAAIPKSPTKYDPVRNPEYNKERRALVLDKMLELEAISQDEYDAAIDADLVLNITYEETQQTGTFSYFTDALLEQIIKDLEAEYGYTRQEALNLIYTGGLKIYTTENPVIQKTMEEVFNDPDTFATVDDGVQPQSAMVIMDPYTGEVVGLVGGRGEKQGKLELNRATMSKRQVGSSIKPLTVYAPAMDLGLINYSTVFDDTPIYMERMGKYWPTNSPNRYFGKIDVNQAIVLSKNTIAVKVVKEELGVEYAYNFAKNNLHLDSLVEADRDIAPLALGGFTNGLTVLEMTAAYSIFPNSGNYSTPRLYTKVLNNDGTMLLDRRTEVEERAIKESTATVMTKHLQNVVQYGTAARIKLKNKINCAGKTGTTNDNKDLYFCGFTPYYVGACWFGYDIPKSLYKFGGNPAMNAWEKVMEKVHAPILEKASSGEEKLKSFDFSKLRTASFCLDSGMVPTENCSLDLRGKRIGTGYYYEGEGRPTRSCNVHVMVPWCNESNLMANDFCTDIRPASLIREESRSFTHGNVLIEDAIYTYRDVDIHNYKEIPHYPPFYMYTLAEGETTGYSKYSEGAAVNGMCRIHGAPVEEPEKTEETEAAAEADDASKPGAATESGDSSQTAETSEQTASDEPNETTEISGDLSGVTVNDNDNDNTLE